MFPVFRLNFIGLVALGVLVTGCQSPVKNSGSTEYSDDMARLINMQRKQIEELKSENQTLKSDRSKGKSKVDSLSSQMLLRKYKRTSNKKVYQKSLRAYHEQNLPMLFEHVQILKIRGAKSEFLDNVEMLVGQHFMDSRNYSKALRVYNNIIGAYPASEMRAKAYLHKGFAYKMLDLKKYSKQTFKDLISKYPGSPESYRAKLELDLLEKSL